MTLDLGETSVRPCSVATGRAMSAALCERSMARPTPWAVTRTMAASTVTTRVATGRSAETSASTARTASHTAPEVAICSPNLSQATGVPSARGRPWLRDISCTRAQMPTAATRASRTSKARPRTTESARAAATPMARAMTRSGSHTLVTLKTRLPEPATTTSSGATTMRMSERVRQATRARARRSRQASGRWWRMPWARRSTLAWEAAVSRACARAAGSAESFSTAGSVTLPAFSSMWSARKSQRRARRHTTPSTAERATATPASAWMV